ncbi:DUF732 domain-containing protein [Mycobacterium kyorinense]|uniref:DUF732 domain-containing protein n=1 Tax=Mycobacterium kyorinense TaxID=487514 RepID=UPI001301BC7B
MPADLAWSLDTEETPTHDRRWRGPVTSAVLVTLLCLIVAVVTWFSITLYHENDSRPPASTPASSAVPKAAPPPPPPVTVTATPAPPPTPAPTTTPVLSDTDRQFLDTLRHRGVNYPYSNPEYPIVHAHAVCDYMNTHHFEWGEDHEASVDKYVETTTIWYGDDAVNFQGAARASYCPSTVNPEY